MSNPPPLRLVFSRDADKFLKDLQAKQYKQILSKILDMTRDPEPPDSSKLQGHPFRRVDSGEFRIIYRYDADMLYITRIGKRNDDEVYRNLPS